MPIHTNEKTPCPLCEKKLISVHPKLAAWFRSEVKPKFPDAHISCGWRGKIEQNQVHAEGKSKLPWPKSKHNAHDIDGMPCAEAIDLFELASNGMAVWAYKYFRTIAEHAEESGAPITWGGRWEKFPDYPHYQLT